MNIANTLTFTRIFISPIFLLVYIEHEMLGISNQLLPYILLLLLGVSELSDAVDGYIARNWNQVTDFGKLFDPMADSIYRISIFLTFTQPPVLLPMPLIFIFIYRDSVISTLRTICALKGFALAARTSGKIKAVFQALAAFAVICLMIPFSMNLIEAKELSEWSTWIVGTAALFTLLTGIDYLYANRSYIAKVLVQPSLRKKQGLEHEV